MAKPKVREHKQKVEEEKSKEELQVEQVTDLWRKVLKAYGSFRDTWKEFCIAAEGIKLDHAGPQLGRALRLYMHRRRFEMFLEDLVHEDRRYGGVHLLTPPDSSTDKE